MSADATEAASSYDAPLARRGAGEYDEEEAASLIAAERLPQRSSTGSRSSWTPGSRAAASKSPSAAILRWMKGPNPPRIYRIRSSEWLQVPCDRLLGRCLPGKGLKLCLLLLLCVLWVGMFIFALPPSVKGGNGSVTHPPARLSCTSQLWYVPNSTG